MDQSTAVDSDYDPAEDYPEGLPDQLQWLADRFHLSQERILRLMRLRPADRAEWQGRSWREIAERFEPQAYRVEHLLTHYLDYFNYDVEAALRLAHGFPERVRSGELVLEHMIPDYDPAAPLGEREDALVRAINEDGAKLMPALATFLTLSDMPGSTGPAESPRRPPA